MAKMTKKAREIYAAVHKATEFEDFATRNLILCHTAEALGLRHQFFEGHFLLSGWGHSSTIYRFPQAGRISDHIKIYKNELRDVLTSAIEATGLPIEGPTNWLEADHTPVWVCDAREILSKCK